MNVRELDLYRVGEQGFCSLDIPWTLELKFGTYLEKERLRLLHSVAVIFLVALAPSSFVKKTSK